jgi:uncharacterized membrane protein
MVANVDLVGAMVMTVVAAVFAYAPGPITPWTGGLFLLLVPGYVLVQAIVRRPRLWHAAAAPGLGIPVVGLLALATALLPRGFVISNIIAVVAVGTLGLAAAAWWRRATPQRQGPTA